MKMDVDELQTFQQQALEIRQPDADFDPSIAPQNGEEFLMHMVYERKRCPAVVVKRPAKVKDLKDELNTTQTASEVTPDDSRSCLLPTVEWKDVQAADFLVTRDRITKMRQQLAAHKYDQELEPPLTTDAVEWLKFCRENQPLLRTVLRLNQRSLEQLLEMLTDWLSNDEDKSPEELPESTLCASSSSSAAAAAANNGETTTAVTTLDLANSEQWLGSWLYATLVCLHLPIEPEVHSTLRDIARACIRLRDRLLPQEVEKAVPYNLFIHLISSVFDQLDFAECV